MNERKPILELVASLGYAVSVHRVNGVVEMHAVQLAYPCAQHLSRVLDGDGPEEDYPVVGQFETGCLTREVLSAAGWRAREL